MHAYCQQAAVSASGEKHILQCKRCAPWQSHVPAREEGLITHMLVVAGQERLVCSRRERTRRSAAEPLPPPSLPPPLAHLQAVAAAALNSDSAAGHGGARQEVRGCTAKAVLRGRS